MNCFFDFEFSGLHQHTTPISLGMVAQDGRSFYAEFTDYSHDQIDDWLKENVMAHLIGEPSAANARRIGADVFSVGNREHIAHDAMLWLQTWESIEMWGDTLAYDWVLFCELFGGAKNIPKSVYYIPFDIATLFKIHGVDPDIGREDYADGPYSSPKHSALADARVIKRCYNKLTTGRR